MKIDYLDKILFSLSLKFKNPRFEKEFFESSLRHQGLHLLLTVFSTVAIITYDTITVKEIIPESYHYFIRGGLILLGCISLLTFISFPRIQEVTAFLFVLLVICYFSYLQTIVNNPLKYDDHKKGVATALMYIGLLFSLKRYWLRVLFQILIMINYVVILEFDSVPFITLMVLCYWIVTERVHRLHFKGMKEWEESLNKFKKLVSEDFPASIVILDSKLNEIKFANKEFMEQISSKENLGSIVITDDTVGSIGVKEPESPLMRLERIRDHPKRFGTTKINQHFTGKLIVHEKVKYFEIKLRKVVWEMEESFAMILNDITEKVNIVGVQKISEYKDQVIAAVSHEIRTPLTGILGMLLIALSKSVDSDLQSLLKNCQSCANLLLSFVNSILDISQIKEHKLKLNFTTFAITEITDFLNSIFFSQAQAKKVLFQIICSPGLPKYINTDKNRVLQILVNLITNALKFTKEGGSVTLDISRDSDNRKRIYFQIKDTGIGIKEEDLEKLFQRFGKLEQEDKTVNTTGVGLGLTISNDLVRILNGENKITIRVESKYGKGSIFSFYIPWEQKRVSAITAIPSTKSEKEMTDSYAEGNSLNGDHILPLTKTRSTKLFASLGVHQHSALIVDDSHFNLIAMTFQLEKLNMKVKTAISGLEAIKLLETQEFDIVFMDINMPIMNGYEVSKIINQKIAEGKIKTTPIIALTAQDINDQFDFDEAGMIDFLSKPINESELKDLLGRWIKNSNL